MIRYLYSVTLVILIASGCAAAPREAQVGAQTTTNASNLAEPNGVAVDAAAIEPDLVIDVKDLAARAAPDIICRDTLRRNSNVIIRQCMTAEDWKRYRQAEALEAARLVRMMQGNPYR